MLQELIPTQEGDLVINIGPQHPSTHGVLHLVITMNGETIKKIEPHLGYIHRSIEKMCESLNYRQFRVAELLQTIIKLLFNTEYGRNCISEIYLSPFKSKPVTIFFNSFNSAFNSSFSFFNSFIASTV